MDSLKQELIEYLKLYYTPGQKWNDIGEKFRINPEKARKIWLGYRKKHDITGEIYKTEVTEEPKVTEFQEDIKNGKGEVTIQSASEIKSLDDLKTLIDTEKWDITKYIQNYWNNKYQVKAWLEPKKINETELIDKILSNYKTTWKGVKDKDKIINNIWTDESLLFLNLPDLHFDKRDIDGSTIEDNLERYRKVLEYLVTKAYHSSNLDKIVFVIGNDVFNTDNYQGCTTNGTPQRNNETWDTAYEKVFDELVNSISYLSSFANQVHVVLVQGNHDRTKSYFLAHALEAYFKSDPTITFDRSIESCKAITYGNSFIGLNHGNNLNDKLPLVFATKFAPLWGESLYHDIYIGDKHHNNEKVFVKQAQNDGYQGVKLRMLPSLSKPDEWHTDNLFYSRQSGIGIVYEKRKGKSAEFEYQI